ncbi:MAG: xanthine dehydrogenase family protein subunit [Clostridiales bacterium]|jgi:CO/xanthine dehydrogenase FAD-binding subunit|nr:xanthine dehydrogenase family protein subunit [Clostridiales bacterium]
MVGLYPKYLEEAVEMKYAHKEAKLYAGGTDWMVRHAECNQLLFLNQIQELKVINEDTDNIYIGSGCTYFELLNNDLVPEILKEAIRGIAAPAIKNIGTIGGNICNASPAGDTLPILYALGAKVEVISVDKNKIFPIEDFILGVRKLLLNDTEILKRIIIQKHEFSNTYYQKVGARKSQALSKASFVGLANIQEGKLVDLRIAFGSVASTIIRVKQIEEKYIDINIKELPSHIGEIKADYDSYIIPIDDQRSTASYRKAVCMNLLEDFLRKLK